jgi:hypothetical protein
VGSHGLSSAAGEISSRKKQERESYSCFWKDNWNSSVQCGEWGVVNGKRERERERDTARERERERDDMARERERDDSSREGKARRERERERELIVQEKGRPGP